MCLYDVCLQLETDGCGCGLSLGRTYMPSKHTVSTIDYKHISIYMYALT